MSPLLLLIPGGLLAMALLSRKGWASMLSDSEVDRLYRTLPPAAQQYLQFVLQAAQDNDVSPYILLAIMDRESRYGLALRPPGPGGTGDNGHGRGLMQIDDRSDPLMFDWRDPQQNIQRGAEILRAKLQYFEYESQGEMVSLPESKALRLGVPVGEYSDPRPLSGSDLLQAGIAAYNAGQGNVLYSIMLGFDPDTLTAGGDYSKDVLARAEALK